MIINVGGRTDIVNYYHEWLVNRIREGFVYTRNPYHKNQVLEYDLNPDVVDCICFCSKNYKPILGSMEDITSKFNVFCYYTITSYGDDVEPFVPSIDESIDTFIELSDMIGKEKVSWRFDPILLTKDYSIDYHLESFEYICRHLAGYTSFCVFSFVDMYKKLYRNMPEIIELSSDDMLEIVKGIGRIAGKYNLSVQTCATRNDYTEYGVNNSGCITRNVLENANNVKYKRLKQGKKRSGCTCMPWRDIGAYDTCLNSCKYCYANKNPKVAHKNYKFHDKNSPLLIGNIRKNDVISHAKQQSFLVNDKTRQSKLDL